MKGRKDYFTTHMNHLYTRGLVAYREADDERMIKLINCLCKAAETRQKLDAETQERIELLVDASLRRGEDGP